MRAHGIQTLSFSDDYEDLPHSSHFTSMSLFRGSPSEHDQFYFPMTLLRGSPSEHHTLCAFGWGWETALYIKNLQKDWCALESRRLVVVGTFNLFITCRCVGKSVSRRWGSWWSGSFKVHNMPVVRLVLPLLFMIS